MTTYPTPAPFEFAKVRWIYYGLMVGMFTASISQTIVSPAIPRIISDLGGVQYYAWLSTIVMLTSAVITPISGKLADMFGRKRFYVIALVVFMLGSMLSGVAQSFTWLIVSRAFQGMGMGVIMALSQTILGDVIPPRQRGRYAGYMGAMMGAAQVAGPLIGGVVTDAFTWRVLFYINLPVGLAALFLIVRFMHVPELDIPRTIDYGGITTMTIGVTAALLGISFGPDRGWLDPLVVGLLFIGVVGLTLFVMIERRAAEPIVPMYLFRNSIFTWSVIAACLMNAALMVLIIYTPVYAQGVLGVTATVSGLILIPMNVALFLMGVVIGNLVTRTGRYKSFMVGGAALVILASILLLRLDSHSSPWELGGYTLLFGLGTGMTFQLYTLVVQNAVQRRDLGPATASLQFFRNTANTLATAVAGTLMTSHLVQGIDARMTDEVREHLPPEGLDPNVVLNHDALLALAEPVAQVLKLALAEAMHGVYLLLPFLGVVVLAATLAIRAIPLRDSFEGTEERGLEAATRSNADPNTIQTAAAHHARGKERMMAAHLILLADHASRGGNEILRAAVAEFGGGDLARGVRLLHSTATMLLAEDPDVIDEHERFAVELSALGRREQMLSPGLTARLDDIATRVAARAADVNEPSPATEPRLASVEGVDVRSLNRAVWMLDTALVADAAARYWLLDDEDETDAESRG
ncbi:MAG: MDR family MFS transporter [Propioniciclava sp.]|uniref:MDR family MFS transporter n=1 Tax=Propioniciclava sp. TaxID=2038686 RepID=UPI0039E5D295